MSIARGLELARGLDQRAKGLEPARGQEPTVEALNIQV